MNRETNGDLREAFEYETFAGKASPALKKTKKKNKNTNKPFMFNLFLFPNEKYSHAQDLMILHPNQSLIARTKELRMGLTHPNHPQLILILIML